MSIRMILVLLLITSCSTLKKSMITSAVVGGILGSVGGVIFSPDNDSANKNAFLFGTLGAAVGSSGAYLMHEKPIDQQKLNQMLLDDQKEVQKELPLYDFSPELKKINPKVDFKPISKYEVPLTKLPPELQGKVKKQYIIEYHNEAKTLQIGNRTFEISPFKAWEHVYED